LFNAKSPFCNNVGELKVVALEVLNGDKVKSHCRIILVPAVPIQILESVLATSELEVGGCGSNGGNSVITSIEFKKYKVVFLIRKTLHISGVGKGDDVGVGVGVNVEVGVGVGVGQSTELHTY
jgi:hypothetical protein